MNLVAKSYCKENHWKMDAKFRWQYILNLCLQIIYNRSLFKVAKTLLIEQTLIRNKNTKLYCHNISFLSMQRALINCKLL